MFDNIAIVRLYARVLHDDIFKYKVSAEDIREGIENMKQIYLPNPTSLTSEIVDIANYDDAAHRCAYLHKYAPLHTIMVYHMINRALFQNFSVFQNILRNGCLKLCSLGGGPGSDVLGVLAAIHENFGFCQISVTIVDYMVNWSITFSSIVQELQFGNYGTLGGNFSPHYFNWTYIGHNLLGKMSKQVNRAIAFAEIITMVKFVSAAACKDTYQMIKKIFNTMKPGAIVLYIDNAGGGFYELVSLVATECSFVTVFGPLKHEHYVNENINIKRFGYTSCYETKITVHIWQKPIQNQILNQFIKHSHGLLLNQNEQNADSRRDITTTQSAHINNQSQSSSMQRNNSRDNIYSETIFKYLTSFVNMNRNAPITSQAGSASGNKSSQQINSGQNTLPITVEQPKFMTSKPSSSVNRDTSNTSQTESASDNNKNSQQIKSGQNTYHITVKQPKEQTSKRSSSVNWNASNTSQAGIASSNNKCSQQIKSGQNTSQITVKQPKEQTSKRSSSVNRNASNTSQAGSASSSNKSSQQIKSGQNTSQITVKQPKEQTSKRSSSVNRNASNTSQAGSASSSNKSSQQIKSGQNTSQITVKQPKEQTSKRSSSVNRNASNTSQAGSASSNNKSSQQIKSGQNTSQITVKQPKEQTSKCSSSVNRNTSNISQVGSASDINISSQQNKYQQNSSQITVEQQRTITSKPFSSINQNIRNFSQYGSVSGSNRNPQQIESAQNTPQIIVQQPRAMASEPSVNDNCCSCCVIS